MTVSRLTVLEGIGESRTRDGGPRWPWLGTTPLGRSGAAGRPAEKGNGDQPRTPRAVRADLAPDGTPQRGCPRPRPRHRPDAVWAEDEDAAEGIPREPAAPASGRPGARPQPQLSAFPGSGRASRPLAAQIAADRLRPMGRSLLTRIHNPYDRRCGCNPTCWCKRSRLGYAFRWYVPSRFHLPGPGRLRFTGHFGRPS